MSASKWFCSLLLLAQAAYAIHIVVEVFGEGFGESIRAYTEQYIERDSLPSYTGGLLPWLDFHINLVVIFFRNYFLIRPVQWAVAEIWFGGILPTLVWMNMESERVGLIGSPLFFALFQLLGISIFYPLVSIYYLFSMHKSSTRTNFANPLSSLIQILFIVVPLLVPFYHNNLTILTNCLTIFVLAPCVVPVFSYFFFPRLSSVTPQRAKTSRPFFVALIGFAGALGFYLHLRGILAGLTEYWLRHEEFQYEKLAKDLFPNLAHAFLRVDLGVTFLTTYTVVLATGGFVALILVLLGSVALSPALSLAIFYVYLETQKDAASSTTTATTKKKNN